jgi:uncharacterized membrane protein YidH (DUF202 family)
VTARPWDSGLQNERTGLAWQRTMLAGLTCSLLVARLLAGISVVTAVLTGLVALLTTAAMGWMAISRFRINSHALHARRPIGDGRPQLLVSLVVTGTALGALAFALLG